MNEINLPPYAPALMEATRAIGYSFETAMADVLDNSIAADATTIEINFFPIDNPYISILDNGYGMTKKDLINAMRYGSRNPLDIRSLTDLGRFGMGLKTASMSQCRKLTVISKTGEEVVGAQWDLDYVALTGNWSLKIIEGIDLNFFPHIENLKAQKSGTLILWQDLDRMQMGQLNFDTSMGKYMDKAREHLSLVFHRYLKGEAGLKKVIIKLNDIKLEAIDPFLIGKSTQSMDEEIILVEKEKVIVRPYTLPHISQLSKKEIDMLGGKDGIRKRQGFYIYRNKRLLVWGTWFNLMRKGELTKLARVQMDIPNSLDSLWTLDIKKSMAVPPETVKKSVSPIIEKIGASSKRVWTFRGKKEVEESVVHIWKRLKTRDQGVLYELNREHPIVEALYENENINKQLIEQLLKQIEGSLPLNQLYIDLTNDERIINESERSKEEILQLVKQLTSGCSSEDEKDRMIQMLKITEPFDQYPDILSKVNQEVL